MIGHIICYHDRTEKSGVISPEATNLPLAFFPKVLEMSIREDPIC